MRDQVIHAATSRMPGRPVDRRPHHWEAGTFIQELDAAYKRLGLAFQCGGGHIENVALTGVQQGKRRKEWRIPARKRDSEKKVLNG